MLMAFILTAPLILAAPLSAICANLEQNKNPKVKSGDNVYSILKFYGFNDNQRKAALSQNPLPKSFVLSPGDLYSVIKDKKSDAVEVSFYSKHAPISHVFWRKGQASAGAKVKKMNYDIKMQTASGRVRGSLVESISQSVGDDLVAYRFMDAFLLDYNLPKVLQKNAPFSLTFEKLYNNGQFIRYGEVTHAEIEVSGRKIVRLFKNLKDGGVYLNSENDYSDRPFYAPVDYIRISSLYQPRRFHPIKKYRKAHSGIDFELPEGEPIYAINNGVVLRTGKNRAAGRYVVLRHQSGYESYYNHMSAIENFRTGQTINAGTLLGKIGCSGYCTKPHLHFAIKKRGQFVNPISLIKNYSFGQKGAVKQLVASTAW